METFGQDMTRENCSLLYRELVDGEFYFISNGIHHIGHIYNIVATTYPHLCDDDYNCRLHSCRNGTNNPEWMHRVRTALGALKDRRIRVSKDGCNQGYWKFD